MSKVNKLHCNIRGGLKNRKGEKVKFTDLAKMVIHKPSPQRFIEIDMLRGLAILLMIFGHILWDLDHFGLVPLNSGIYSSLQNFVPQLFFVVVGSFLILSKKINENKKKQVEKKYLKPDFV